MRVPITAERAEAAGFKLTDFERRYMTIKGTPSGIWMRPSTAKLRKALHDHTLTADERHICWCVLQRRRRANTRIERERLANWNRKATR